jgi:hypothetical protein
VVEMRGLAELLELVECLRFDLNVVHDAHSSTLGQCPNEAEGVWGCV